MDSVDGCNNKPCKLPLDAGDVFEREDDGEEALERNREGREDGPNAEGVNQSVAGEKSNGSLEDGVRNCRGPFQ